MTARQRPVSRPTVIKGRFTSVLSIHYREYIVANCALKSIFQCRSSSSPSFSSQMTARSLFSPLWSRYPPRRLRFRFPQGVQLGIRGFFNFPPAHLSTIGVMVQRKDPTHFHAAVIFSSNLEEPCRQRGPAILFLQLSKGLFQQLPVGGDFIVDSFVFIRPFVVVGKKDHFDLTSLFYRRFVIVFASVEGYQVDKGKNWFWWTWPNVGASERPRRGKNRAG